MTTADAHIGTFEVMTDAAAVSAFRAATGVAGPGVPLTFPIRWLAMPEIKSAMTGLVTEDDLVLIHESQSFEYKHALRENESYTLDLTARRESGPDRLVASADVRDKSGASCATLETILRLFSTKAVAA